MSCLHVMDSSSPGLTRCSSTHCNACCHVGPCTGDTHVNTAVHARRERQTVLQPHHVMQWIRL